MRYAFRLIFKHPGLSLVAILSLSLGIGANVTIFSFADALFFTPPPAAHPKQLVEVWIHDPSPGAALSGHYPLSYLDWKDYASQTQSLSGLAIYDPAVEASVKLGDGSSTWSGQMTSANYFDVLGIQPALGRWFLPQEGATPGSSPVLVLSYAAWQQDFGGAREVLGRTVQVDGNPFTVIGVAPRGFNGVIAGVEPKFWLPITMAAQLGMGEELTGRGNHSEFAFGRLRPGVTVAAASAELDLIQHRMDHLYPKHEPSSWGGEVDPLGMIPTPFRTFIGAGTALLGVVVGLVLLIACANAGLVLLVLSLARRREWAIRTALGATRGRIVRQGLVHSLLLALIAGAMGVGWASLLEPLLLRLRPQGFPVALQFHLDGHLLLFTLGVAVIAGLVFGLAPAWNGARTDVNANLKDGTPGSGSSRSRARSAFITAQVALCVVILVGSALCLRSLLHAGAIDPGFDTQHLIMAEILPGAAGYTGPAASNFLRRVQSSVAALPGVKAVSYETTPPLQLSESGTEVLIPGMSPPPHHAGYDVDYTEVAPHFFRASGTHLVAGRDFTAADLAAGHPAEVVVNETMARQFWPHQNAVGQTVLFPGNTKTPSAQVVGVAQNGKYRSLAESPRAYMYRLQNITSGAAMVVRVAGSPRAFLAAVRNQLQSLDPDLTSDNIQTIQQYMAVPLFPARFTGIMLGGFGILALLLAVVGLYGVIAAAVAQRTREYGIRMALGAGRPELLRLVVGQGVRLAGWGILAGLVLAALLTHFMAALLYGLSPLDPMSYLIAVAILLAVAALASYLPARRAAALDPLRALRYE